MNIWNALPWGKHQCRVSVDFSSFGSSGFFCCHAVFWIHHPNPHSPEIDNLVTAWINTENRQEPLKSVWPSIVLGGLLV